MFKIDVGVPISKITSGRKPTKFPFTDMEVGDSVFVPEAKPNSSYASAATRNYSPHKFIQRTVIEDGVKGLRIWRTE